jgi:hypothetical protein
MCAGGGTGTSGFFSRGHMLSRLHTVDIENLIARVGVGGIGGKGGSFGGDEERITAVGHLRQSCHYRCPNS